MKKFLYVICLKTDNSDIVLEIPFFADNLIDLHKDTTFKDMFEIFRKRFSDFNVLKVSVCYVGRVKLSKEHDVVYFDLTKE